MDTLADALEAARGQGLERLDAQLLLLHALGRDAGDRAWLIAHDRDPLSASAAQVFATLCRRRLDGEPVAYLVGRKEFYGLPLAVDARVLVPRPETETLVDWALALLPVDTTASVVDLGTGSGAIALAVARHRSGARVAGVDRSPEALAVAAGNGQRLGLPVQWLLGDWLAGVSGRHALLVSNPPYVAAGDPHLAALRHEPPQALAAGADGLDDIRTLVRDAPRHLQPGGWLLLEHGWDQAEAVRGLLAQAGFADVQSRADLAGIPRCSGGRWLEHG